MLWMVGRRNGERRVVGFGRWGKVDAGGFFVLWCDV
jgi:hypothetical protein